MYVVWLPKAGCGGFTGISRDAEMCYGFSLPQAALVTVASGEKGLWWYGVTLKHHWGGGKAAQDFGLDRIRTLVSMETDSSHGVKIGKILLAL